MFSKPKTRIKSLRRTLRERPVLARYVREIRVLDFSRELAVSAEASIEIRNQLASLVMACPSLERLTGLYPPHFHDYDRLTHALSTRRMLKEKLWVIGPNHLSASAGHVEPLNAYQIDGYIQMHSRWSSLETLILNCAQGGVLDHPQMFSASFRFLPNLKNLHISGFSAYDFNDRHLSSLPATLRSLRLEALPGISEEGLIHHLTTHLHLNDRAHLKSLTLIDMNLHFLSSIASLLGHLYNLRRMTIVTSSLDPPSGVPVTEIWQPFCSSRSLEHLHWEINPWINSPSPEFAHYILAESIRSGGFPRLQTLRAPNDPSGILQSACRPLSPPPKVSFGLNGQVVERKPATCHSCFSKGVDGAQHTACYASSIAHAIERAHDRAHTALFPARRVGQNAVCRYSVIEGDVDPYIRIVAADEEGMLIEAYDSPTFLGAMGPKAPRYALESDVQGCDAALAVVEDVILREAPRFGRGDGGYERRLKWKGVRVETLF
jgi:hypothetical protein